MEKVKPVEFVDALRQNGRDAEVFPESVKLIENIPFSNISGRELCLDAYDLESPPSSPRPAIVFVHGGGWWTGHKKHFWAQAAYLALRYGLFSVCITYRLSKEAQFPAPIQDVKCAIRWVRSKSAEYKIDTERIAIAGGSAGGHLSALAATTKGVSEYDGVGGHRSFSSHVNLAIILNGVLDLVDEAERRTEPGSGSMIGLMGGTLDEKPQAFRDASPFHRANQDVAPMLLLHGKQDVVVPWQQARDMHEKLLGLGVPSELEVYDGVGHAWFNKAPHFLVVLKRIEPFLEKHFRLTPVWPESENQGGL
jgi:acetyl esterase/lipase